MSNRDFLFSVLELVDFNIVSDQLAKCRRLSILSDQKPSPLKQKSAVLIKVLRDVRTALTFSKVRVIVLPFLAHS